MELSPREATRRPAVQEIPNTLCNPKAHYRVHKSRPLVPVLSQANPSRTTPFYFSKIYLNIILPPASRPSQWSLSIWLSHQNPIGISLLPNACCMPCPSRPPWLDHSNYTWRRIQVMKLLIMLFSPTSCHFIPLRSAAPSHTLKT
jgi:hypothetical protein